MARVSLPAIAAGETGLSHYLSEIRKFPMLAPDEEYMLAKRYKEHGDRDAAHRLVTSNLRKVKGQIQALDEGDLRPEQVTQIATRLGVTEEDVVSMNRRLSGDTSLNAPLRSDGETGAEWQDWLVDDSPDQEERLAESEE